MAGIIVVTHGKMSEGIIDATNLIFGEIENLETINLLPKDEVSDLQGKILAAHERVDQGDGVIIMVDLMSASPFNQASMAVNSLSPEKQEKTIVLTGVNLPMILEAANQNLIGADIEDAATAIENTGKEGIVKWSIADVLEDEDDDDF
jgi:PTS system mannose-specific IIA component